jgi:hypothetical protein
MHNPYIAILAAGVAAWLFGAVWYTTLGKVWQAALGNDPEGCKGKKMPLTLLLMSFLAALVIAVVLSQLLVRLGVVGWLDGAKAGLILGIGFQLTAVLVNNLFQQKKLLVTAIDGGHWVLAAAIQGAVLGALL